jgi:hypothetical protein
LAAPIDVFNSWTFLLIGTVGTGFRLLGMFRELLDLPLPVPGCVT